MFLIKPCISCTYLLRPPYPPPPHRNLNILFFTPHVYSIIFLQILNSVSLQMLQLHITEKYVDLNFFKIKFFKMSVNNKPQCKRAPGLVKSEVIHQKPIFFFTFLSAVINMSALSSDYFYYSCKIAEAHLSFTYKFNNAQWIKRSSLLKHLFLRMQKHFPRSLSGFSHTYHLFELYYMPIPKSITGKGSGTSLP